ncbi:MAG: histone deacetylase family protein [Dehalococcoidia bacterium]|jgi:acetoin utilization deacetylase AcuC-like enzyme
MKVVYHQRFTQVYENDPAAEPGRMEAIIKELAGFEVIEPQSARLDDILLCHTSYHLGYVQGYGNVFEMAMLAAGGALKAAEIGSKGKAAFAAIRPPGHHASADSCWGFCFFNNIAIALSRLLEEKKIGSALVLDFDLHFGDGTANIFESNPAVTYFHPEDGNRQDFVDHVKRFLDEKKADIIAVSAGFDRHIDDWGRLLTTEDYRTIGGIVKQYALKNCNGRRFGVLEGGYNHLVLGQNVRAFLEGMD